MKSGSASDWLSYRHLRNKVNSMLRSAKAAYFDELGSSLKSKPGKFWRHFQSLSKHSKSICNSQFSATADAFNDYFLSIPYKTVANVTSTVPATEYMDKLYDRATPSLEFVPVDVESVSSLISSLHIQKASGVDGLSARFIRASPYMVRLVTVLINKCIESSLVPFSVEAGYCYTCA
ncbi:MAG: hypothetical protein OXG81_11355 [Acidobacteria bacterium]|nr:hypothetical protein [Acidobacteriota bacterium]